MSENDFRERLQTLIGSGAANAFAKKCAIPESLVPKYLSGDSLPGFGKNFAIAKGGNVRPEWLLTGEGPMRWEPDLVMTTPDGKEILIEVKGRTADREDEFTPIPKRDVMAAAGDHVRIPGEEIIDVLLFTTNFLRRELGVDPEALVLIQARGDSMQPTIDDGDLLLVDCSQALDADNAIYVLNVKDRILVKRLHFKIDGSIVVLSDNPKYRAESVRPRDKDLFRVVGRVVWSGGRL